MKTPPALFSPIPGVEINPAALTVRVSPAAFEAWPWSGLAFPCKGELKAPAVFSFEGSPPAPEVIFPFRADYHPYNLAGMEGDPEACVDPSALSALADDCAALLACFDCMPDDGDAEKLLKALFEMEMPPDVLKQAREEGERAGRNAAAWIAQDSFGGRVACAKEARETARRILQMLEDGDPALALHEIDPPGDWIIGTLFAAESCGPVYSQRFDKLLALFDTLGIRDTLEEWGREIDETRDLAFSDALQTELSNLAAAAAGEEEGK